MNTGVITYPVPAYANLPIEPQFYQPSRFVISNVAIGVQTTVTTTTNMNYVIGQEVRLLIPPSFGCFQLNGQTGYILAIPAANQVKLSLNSSRNVSPYIASNATTVAQIVAIGDINNGYISTNGLSVSMIQIPGAFINIS
jgi:hypothetical protein